MNIAVELEYMKRQQRLHHPEGRTDNGGRWYPDEEERQQCCDSVRTPSRSYPWSLMTHCRSKKHIAMLYAAHPEKFDDLSVDNGEYVEYNATDHKAG